MTAKDNNLATIAVIAEKAPFGRPGRTAMVKFLYFLQTIRGVPLGYNFTLYSYGPFDSEVLSDIEYAVSLGIVTSTIVTNPSGYGYEVSPGPNRDEAKARAAGFLDKYSADIDWVLQRFGRFNASDLELTSTTVFVDREVHREGRHLTQAELATRVKEVKPHFTEARIQSQVLSLLDQLLATN